MRFLPKNNYFDGAEERSLGVPGCIKHTDVVTLMILEARKNRGDLAVVWLDLASAYG